jgi:DnaJ-class molecular chaperone
MSETKKCPVCDGVGFDAEKERSCPKCKGSGLAKKLVVKNKK